MIDVDGAAAALMALYGVIGLGVLAATLLARLIEEL